MRSCASIVATSTCWPASCCTSCLIRQDAGLQVLQVDVPGHRVLRREERLVTPGREVVQRPVGPADLPDDARNLRHPGEPLREPERRRPARSPNPRPDRPPARSQIRQPNPILELPPTRLRSRDRLRIERDTTRTTPLPSERTTTETVVSTLHPTNNSNTNAKKLASAQRRTPSGDNLRRPCTDTVSPRRRPTSGAGEFAPDEGGSAVRSPASDGGRRRTTDNARRRGDLAEGD